MNPAPIKTPDRPKNPAQVMRTAMEEAWQQAAQRLVRGQTRARRAAATESKAR